MMSLRQGQGADHAAGDCDSGLRAPHFVGGRVDAVVGPPAVHCRDPGGGADHRGALLPVVRAGTVGESTHGRHPEVGALHQCGSRGRRRAHPGGQAGRSRFFHALVFVAGRPGSEDAAGSRAARIGPRAIPVLAALRNADRPRFASGEDHRLRGETAGRNHGRGSIHRTVRLLDRNVLLAVATTCESTARPWSCSTWCGISQTQART